MSSKTKNKKARGVSKASAWGRAKTSNVVLDLPSGEVVLVRRVVMPQLLASGAFPDSLMAIVSEKIESATGAENAPKEVDPAVMQDMMKDPKKLSQLFDSVDKIMPIVVVEPAVLNHKRPVTPDDLNGEWEVIPEEERDEDVLYTDVVDLEDKMHIFQFAVGGTRDVEEFRSGLKSAVGDV